MDNKKVILYGVGLVALALIGYQVFKKPIASKGNNDSTSNAGGNPNDCTCRNAKGEFISGQPCPCQPPSRI